MATENICRNRPEGCSTGTQMRRWCIATRPVPTLSPRVPAAGAVLCIKPAKSVSRAANLPRAVNQARRSRARVALVFDKLPRCCTLARRRSSLRPRCFEPAKRASWHFSPPPWSDTSGHLGGAKSALTGAFRLSLAAAARASACYDFDAVPANHPGRRALLPVAHARI